MQRVLVTVVVLLAVMAAGGYFFLGFASSPVPAPQPTGNTTAGKEKADDVSRHPQQPQDPSVMVFFAENKGQLVDSAEVLYYTRAGRFAAGFGKGKVFYQIDSEDPAEEATGVILHLPADTSPVGEEPLQSRYNFVLSDVQCTVRHFERVAYRNMKPGLHAFFDIEKPAVVRLSMCLPAGTDLSGMVLRFEGAESIKRRPDGGLRVRTAAGDLAEGAPIGYHEIDGKHQPVGVSWRVGENGEVRFEPGEGYDPSKDLYIET